MPDRTCSVAGCDRPVSARTWCGSHYANWRQDGDPGGPFPDRPKTCTVDGCSKPVRARGWCGMHYERWRNHGHPQGAPERTRNAESPTGRICTVDGCDRPSDLPGCARGWCGRHYQRWQRWGDPLGRPDYINSDKVCAIDGCNEPAKTRGWCGRHYMRWHQTGSVRLLAEWANAPAGQRWCSHCKTYKPRADFYENRSKPDGVSRWCKDCDRLKSAEWVRRNPAKAKAQAKRRRHQLRAAYRGRKSQPFTREQIAQRDRWVCKLCGKRIDRRKVFPDRESLSIDHIIPLAAGGDHVPSNVQAAHFSCNARKQARGGGQLLLF